MLRKFADGTRPNSLSSRLRRRRFAFFLQLLEGLPRPLRILDVGGTRHFWNNMHFDPGGTVEIVLLNLSVVPVNQPWLQSVVGDARSLPQYEDGAFDLVFSNSVIEHVGSWEDQQRMAAEVRRVGQRYFVQTPNYYFPLEPHFLFPGFQFLPVEARIWLITHFKLGWHRRYTDRAAAAQAIAHTRLLKRRELEQLFPDAQIYQEKLLGLSKSYVAYGGF